MKRIPENSLNNKTSPRAPPAGVNADLPSHNIIPLASSPHHPVDPAPCSVSFLEA